MRFNHLKSLWISVALLGVLLAVGFSLSQRKLLWNDELFTQHAVIETHSYRDILTSQTPDGNKNPLFYIIQKSICDIFSFHLPASCLKDFKMDYSRTRDIPSQTILRIPSNLYMSVGLALIFYFFIRFYSLGAALFALSVALSVPLVWMNWVEARPYSLWFLLTTMQLLLFYTPVIHPEIKTTRKLFVVHIFLALTTPASMMQIFVIFVLLWWRAKKIQWSVMLTGILPLAIAVLYFILVPVFKTKTYLFFPNLFDGVMPEHLFIYVIYALTAWLLPKQYKKCNNLLFLIVFLLFLGCAMFMLFVDIFTRNSQFGFFSRYLIFLTPADILMFSLASFDLRQWSRPNPWLCLNVSIVLGGLVIVRGLMTYRVILAAATYLHSP